MPDLVKPESNQQLIAKIALTGNLAPLTEEQRWEYYQAYCRYLGLDPITRPFDILTRTEKDGAKIVTLYANASCSSQIADLRGVNYGRPEIEFNDGVGTLTVWVKATLPSGRERWGDGVVHIQALGGKLLENAIKKATTQAHRRATLALCGISMPDESEIEDIPAAQTAQIAAPPTKPQWVDPAEIHEMLEPAREKLAEVKAAQGGGTLTIKKEPEIEPENRATIEELPNYDADHRAHDAVNGARFDALIDRLKARRVKSEAMLGAVNAIIAPREVSTRYGLFDDEVNDVCIAFEKWAEQEEAKAPVTKKAKS